MEHLLGKALIIVAIPFVIATIPSKVFWGMYKNVLTDKGLEQFQKDWEETKK